MFEHLDNLAGYVARGKASIAYSYEAVQQLHCLIDWAVGINFLALTRKVIC